MKIRNKIALQFSIWVALILVVFSVVIFSLSEYNRREDVYRRLRQTAENAARAWVETSNQNVGVMNTYYQYLPKEDFEDFKLLIFNEQQQTIYAKPKPEGEPYSGEVFSKAVKKGYYEAFAGENEMVGLLYQPDSVKFVVLLSAYDVVGKTKVQNLRKVLIISLPIGVGITILVGIFFATLALRPLSQMNKQVSNITAQSLKQRLNEGNRQDEIAQLAMNFNLMLERIEQSFDIQRSFVSNASHELRTPLAALKSEIQVAMEKNRSQTEHQEILQTLLQDTQQLIALTNGLLQLAQSEAKEKAMTFVPLRIDELIFLAHNELEAQHPSYRVLIDYTEIPEDENALTVSGNETLLRTVFSNLMDNACKYSPDHRAEVIIGFDVHHCRIDFKDHGIGIHEEDIGKIFEPFYRARNATNHNGHGIGLSICKRVIKMHQGHIKATSTLGAGSTFSVLLPHV